MRFLWIMIVLACPGFAGDVATVSDAFKEGKVDLNLRFRIESVDQANRDKDALAATLRTRLGFTTATFKGASLHLDFENITAVDDNYNSTTNGVTDRPVVADPETTEVNQVYVDCTALKGNLFRLGRQRIILDNARFVGNVGWRQNEQTFDGALWQNKAMKNTVLSVAFVDHVNRIFGDDHPAGDLDLSSLLANVNIAKLPVGTLAVFAYLVENEDQPAGSHKNLGLRLNGRWKINDRLSMVHDLSYVDQSSYRDGADDFDNDYLAVSWGPNWGKCTTLLGYEAMGGNGTRGFATPLATLHAFNGWADQFLGTPGQGLVDTYLSAKWADKGWNCMLVYHDFASDQGSSDYGTELDALVAKKLNKRALVGVKYADYQADDFGVDTTKLWGYAQISW